MDLQTIGTRQSELDVARNAVQQNFPRLQGFRFDVRSGQGAGHLEFYAPDESYSPNPGIPTLEVRNPALKGRELHDALAGDMLHLLGGYDRESGKPYDPEFRALKETFIKNFTPEEWAFSQKRHADEVKMLRAKGLPIRTFGQFMDYSWADAYIRGFIFPDKADEWRKQARLSPAQLEAIRKMQALLKKPLSASRKNLP